MPPRETAGNGGETLSDDELSDQELIHKLAADVAVAVRAEVAAELGLHRKQLDHIDEMLHGLVQFVDAHRPLLDRVARWGAAGKGWRAWQNDTAPRKDPR